MQFVKLSRLILQKNRQNYNYRRLLRLSGVQLAFFLCLQRIGTVLAVYSQNFLTKKMLKKAYLVPFLTKK